MNTVAQWMALLKQPRSDIEEARLLLRDVMAYRPNTKWQDHDEEVVANFLKAVRNLKKEGYNELSGSRMR